MAANAVHWATAVGRSTHRPGADIPGSGLGLAIVKQVAAMHGGEVRLGDAPESGLRVEITLPMG